MKKDKAVRASVEFIQRRPAVVVESSIGKSSNQVLLLQTTLSKCSGYRISNSNYLSVDQSCMHGVFSEV